MTHLKHFVVLLPLLLSILNLGLTADKPPDIPIYYWGFVAINGQNASDNTNIEAVVNGNVVKETLTPTGYRPGSGYYHLYIPAEYEGMMGTFRVSGHDVVSLILGESGSAKRLDLSFTETTPSSVYSGGSTYSPPTENEVLKAGEATFSFEGGAVSSIVTNIKEDAALEIHIEETSGALTAEVAPGEVYKYINITVSYPDKIGNSTVRFGVEKSWIVENSVKEDTITLFEYEYDVGWIPQPTEKVGENDESEFYKAFVEGFSLFAIAGESGEVVEPEVCTPGNKYCKGNELMVCNEKGTAYETLDVCEFACFNAECVEGICTPGEKRCVGEVAQTCNDTAWVNESCEHGCANGTCVAGTAPPPASELDYELVAGFLVLAAAIIIIMGLSLKFARGKWKEDKKGNKSES